MSKEGKLIALEGPDGSGKTLLQTRLASWMRSDGALTVTTEEHWKGHETGRKIDKVLNGEETMDPLDLQRLFIENRVIHTEQIIKPSLESGFVVFSDRYRDSTPAYCRDEHRPELLEVTRVLTSGGMILKPDLVLMIDVPADVCIARIGSGRSTKTIFEKTEKLENVQRAYRQVFEALDENVVIIDGRGSPEEVFELAKAEIKRRFGC